MIRLNTGLIMTGLATTLLTQVQLIIATVSNPGRMTIYSLTLMGLILLIRGLWLMFVKGNDPS